MPDDDFGYTAWGRDWVRLAEPLRQTRPEPVLPRARKLARVGGVQLTIDGRTVRGVVQRGRTTATPCIVMAPMKQETALAITAQISGGRLILTDDMHRSMIAAGHRLAPTAESIECSCADDTGRCIHLLALFYELARRVDDDPRVALDVQDFARVVPAPSRSGEAPGPAVQSEQRVSSASSEAVAVAACQRWIAIHALDTDRYFEVVQ